MQIFYRFLQSRLLPLSLSLSFQVHLMRLLKPRKNRKSPKYDVHVDDASRCRGKKEEWLYDGDNCDPGTTTRTTPFLARRVVRRQVRQAGHTPPVGCIYTLAPLYGMHPRFLCRVCPASADRFDAARQTDNKTESDGGSGDPSPTVVG